MIEEIPKAYRYQCDACGLSHKQENANGYYTNSTPPRWTTIDMTFYDEKRVTRLFCDECSIYIKRMVREWKGKK